MTADIRAIKTMVDGGNFAFRSSVSMAGHVEVEGRWRY